MTPKHFREFPSGQYTVRVEKNRWRPQTRQITVRDLQETKIDVELEPLVGSLRIISNPSPATVYLQGERIGTTPLLRQGEDNGISVGRYISR
ncbi:PEGA domain-containing protein [candidate division CSSED10-310 bacterium]|uniref:PEGA domain-containing protein n=1 Tax=candidate division CSSED10-310 bacterium TaxID=2855610 RepID=A0ABV6Z345_UNCC1